jgi:hypothetical protein
MNFEPLDNLRIVIYTLLKQRKLIVDRKAFEISKKTINESFFETKLHISFNKRQKS